jgi:hypothetical protein
MRPTWPQLLAEDAALNTFTGSHATESRLKTVANVATIAVVACKWPSSFAKDNARIEVATTLSCHTSEATQIHMIVITPSLHRLLDVSLHMLTTRSSHCTRSDYLVATPSSSANEFDLRVATVPSMSFG